MNRLVTLHNDHANRVDEITLADRQSTIRTEFDDNDEVTAVVSPTELRVDYTLDGFGNRQQTSTTDWDAISKQNAFDDAGNMISNVDFRGVTTTFTYDALNRLKKTSAPGATAVTLTYDVGVNGVGHLTGAVDESGTTALTYFQSGRLSKAARTVGGRTITTSYRYDDAGRLIELTYPSGRILKLDYLRGKVTGLSFASAPVISGIEYHPFGSPKKWNWGNGKSYARTFNMNGEVETYDLAGSVKTIRRDEAGRIIAIDDSMNPSLNQGFDYDDLDRLTEYHAGSPLTLDRVFTYDGEGNRKSVEVGGTLFTYTYLEGTNLLSTVPGPVLKQWNAADALVKSITDGKNIFKVDPYRRINGVSNSSTNITYLRDYLLRRVSKKFANGTTVHYVYDANDHLIAELDGNGVTLVEYVWLDDMPVAVFQQGAVHYVFADHLNTPRAITDTANDIRWIWHSEPFGSSAANTNPAGKGTFTFNLRFPGQYFDAESSLHHNYFREYDPQTGRYVQSDPIGLAGGINTYSYVSAQPLARVDPMGLQATLPGIPGAPPIPRQAIPGTPQNQELVKATWQSWVSFKDWLDSQAYEKRPRGMNPKEESQYDKHCVKSDDPCRALENAAKQAILAAHPKIGNMLKDEGRMFGNSGWITHGEDLAGRIGTISAMISLGKKMGCDMREEEIMAGALYIPLRPRKI